MRCDGSERRVLSSLSSSRQSIRISAVGRVIPSSPSSKSLPRASVNDPGLHRLRVSGIYIEKYRRSRRREGRPFRKIRFAARGRGEERHALTNPRKRPGRARGSPRSGENYVAARNSERENRKRKQCRRGRSARGGKPLETAARELNDSRRGSSSRRVPPESRFS